MMPIDFPPPEIIEALEEQLGMDFIHFTQTHLNFHFEYVFYMFKPSYDAKTRLLNLQQ